MLWLIRHTLPLIIIASGGFAVIVSLDMALGGGEREPTVLNVGELSVDTEAPSWVTVSGEFYLPAAVNLTEGETQDHGETVTYLVPLMPAGEAMQHATATQPRAMPRPLVVVECKPEKFESLLGDTMVVGEDATFNRATLPVEITGRVARVTDGRVFASASDEVRQGVLGLWGVSGDETVVVVEGEEPLPRWAGIVTAVLGLLIIGVGSVLLYQSTARRKASVKPTPALDAPDAPEPPDTPQA